jgi:hypothetical protein
MGHLSGPQIMGLALWSYGMVLAKNCGQSQVVASLASHLGEKEKNLRQRLREWCWDKKDKQGKKRVDWPVSQNFGPLLSWILSQWPSRERRLVLAMDATSLKQVFVVLSISVVYRGCAIPVAWAILRAGKKGSWKEHWLHLFQGLQGAVPTDWLVVVMADRGLYARWLFEAIQTNHWHPFLRVNLRNLYRLKGTADFRPMSQLLPAPNSVWTGLVTCFAHNSIECALLACWGAHYKEPWLIVTDLSPDYASAAWYGLRSWIEDGFKDLKKGGWQWQNTRMTDPSRAARFWLAIAVATLWVVSIGGEADITQTTGNIDLLPPTHIARKTKKATPSSPRLLSCFSRGLIELWHVLIAQFPIFIGQFYPELWPLKTYP